MPRPEVPDAGERILAAWAEDVIDYIGSKWTFVPLPQSTVVNGVAGPGTTPRSVELTALPANDPKVMAAAVLPMIRNTTGLSKVLTTQDSGGNSVTSTATSGGSSRGGNGPVIMQPLYGANGRSFNYVTTDADCLVYLYLVGYWTQESEEPVDGATEPAISAGEPTLPQDGDEVTVDWAKAVIARAARSERYVPVPRATIINDTNGATTKTDLVVAGLPADPRIVAVAVELSVRMADTSNANITVYDGDTGFLAGICYSTGFASRYAYAGPFRVALGEGQTIKYQTSATAFTNAQYALVGYWIAEPEEV